MTESDSVVAAKHLSQVCQIQADIVNGTDPVDELACERLENLSRFLGGFVPELLVEIENLETALEKAEDKFDLAEKQWASNLEVSVGLFRTEKEIVERCEERITDLEARQSEHYRAIDKLNSDKKSLLQINVEVYNRLLPEKNGTSQTKVKQALRLLNDALEEYGEVDD